MQACDDTSGCKFVEYTGGASSGYCYLKGEIGDSDENGNVWGAKVFSDVTLTSSSMASTITTWAVATPTTILSCSENDGELYTAGDSAFYTVECATDHYAGDMGMSYQQSLDACIKACEITTGCLDVSWVPGGPSRPCYLKSNFG